MSAFPKPIVNYWPMRGRAGSVFLMLDYAGIEYEHKSEFSELATLCSAFGAATDTFAPPIVQDGDKIYSQSTACAVWAGRKAGLAEGVDDIKAMQILVDIIDVMEGGIDGAIQKGSNEFKEFLEGERLGKLLGNLERGIKGTYWFGNSPTYVDFFWTNICDWFNFVCFDRLQSEFGVSSPIDAYPKLKGVASGIRSLEFYKNVKPVGREGYSAKDETFSAWKK